MNTTANTFRLTALRASLLLATAVPAAALPTGGVVTGTSSGQAVTISNAGSTTNVTTGNAKTLIDWSSFGINSGETVNFNMTAGKNSIVVNRQLTGGSSYINGLMRSYYANAGQSTPGGNVWIINPNGISFGPNAVVDVGGLLATTANLKSDSGFLTSAVDAATSFTGDASIRSIYINTGADIQVRDGAATFIAPTIYDYGNVHGGGNNANNTQILFGAAKDYTVRFSTTVPDPLAATDLHLFDLAIDTGTVTNPGTIMHFPSAQTTAGQVIFMAHADATSTYGSHIEIRSSAITATGNRGDGYDLLILGGDNLANRSPAGAPFSSTSRDVVDLDNLYTGDPAPIVTSAGGAYIRGSSVGFASIWSVTIGGVTTQTTPADPAVVFNVAGAAKIVGDQWVDLKNVTGTTPTIVSGGSVSVTNQTAPLTLGDISAVQSVTLESPQNITTGNISGASAVGINSGGSVKVGALNATGSVAVQAANNITLGAVTAGTLNVAAGVKPTYLTSNTFPVRYIQSPPPNGSPNANLAISGPVSTTGASTLSATGNLTVGQVSASSIVATAGGSATTGALNASSSVSVTGGSDVTLGGATGTTVNVLAGNNAVANANATLLVNGAVNTSGNATFVTTGTFRNTAAVTTSVTQGSSSGYYTPISITSRDIDIQAPITATANAGNVGIMLMVQGNGDVALGDNTATPVGIYALSNAEFQQLKAGAVFLVPANTANNISGNLTIGDLAVDASKVGYVALGTGATNTNGQATTASVVGTVTGSGAPTFNIGAHIGSYYLLPTRILISGALGTSVAPLRTVNLNSRGDIVIGSAAFQSAFAAAEGAGADSAFDPAMRSSTEGGVEPGHIFVAANTLGLAANGTIIQQNTDPVMGGGIGSTAVPITVSTFPWTGPGITIPKRVALFGVTSDPSTGKAVQGPQAAAAGATVYTATSQVNGVWIDTNPITDAKYKLNGCTIGSTAACQSPLGLTAKEAQTRPAAAVVSDPTPTSTNSTSDTTAQATSPVLVALPSSGFVQPGHPDDKKDEGSGAANEDLWPKGSR